MSGINKVILCGRLTKDVDVRKTEGGHSVARFTLAVDRDFKKDETDFIRCTAWRADADFLANYGEKGRMCGIVGRIRTGSFEKDGKTQYTFDIDCERVTLLDSKKAGQESKAGDDLPF